ncbi:hypothetical protein TWF718_011006 [Orbilia javanica]|uniref:Uncharacterized protein n=1 Tax=Orbilia javanica TaxID=47235 RepID=A0AAN8RKB3_9PEZI
MRFPYPHPFLLLHLLIILLSSTPAASLNLNPLPLLKRALNFSYHPYTLVAVGRDGRPTTLTVSFTTIIFRDKPSTTTKKASSATRTITTTPTGTRIVTGDPGCAQTVTKRKTVTKYRTATVTERWARTQVVTKYVTKVSTVKEIRTVTETVHVGWPFDGDVDTVVVTEWVK